MIFHLLVLFVIAGYTILLAIISAGWWKCKAFVQPERQSKTKISIVVAVRNEETNIENLIQTLLQQNYPTELLEIILVDDHSIDSTVRLAQDMIGRQNAGFTLKLILLGKEDGFGKKQALNQGIKASTGELIVFTDADCTVGGWWISTLEAYYAKHKPQMILGPVQMTHSGTLFSRLQSLEFMSLISTAAGSCNAGFPLLANGANIVFTRAAFDSCNGFAGNLHYSSGDDMFLMMRIKSKFGAKAIQFLRSPEATVHTPSTSELKPFIQQRLRWVSKSRGYTDFMVIGVSILVFLTNALFIILAITAFVIPTHVELFLSFYFIKMLADFPILYSYSRFQNTKSLLWLFPFMEILNAVYTLFIGIAGNISNFEWKGRKLKP